MMARKAKEPIKRAEEDEDDDDVVLICDGCDA